MTAALGLAADRLEGKDDSPRSRRARLLTEFARTTELARHFDYTTVVTAALELMDTELRRCADARSGRLVLSMPPQEGKTTLLRWLCVALLIENPDLRIGYVSYAATLARGSGRFVRSIIAAHASEMGLRISRDRSDAGDWTIEGHRGGMVSVGVGGALTGRPIDFLVIDDPLSGQKDADSIKVLETQEGWWRSVARTRLAPKASAVVTQTRWAEADLAGNRIAEGWPVINIPAVADGETSDALNRPRGEYLTSTRGREAADWEAVRADVGERVWAALYQGRPAPLEGGVFKREWIERYRRHDAPELRKIITMIDPADNTGSGDEAGVITAGVGADGRYYVLADDSDHMTVGRWFRVAFLAALAHKATEVCYEQSLSGLKRRAKEAWRDLLQDAVSLYRAAVPGGKDPDAFPAVPDEETIYAAAEGLAREDSDDTEVEEIRTRLLELWPLVGRVLKTPETGPPVRAIRPEGDKLGRAKLASPLYESGKTSHVGTFPLLEHTLLTWQEGQRSPDRMDAAVHVLLELSAHAVATRMSSANRGRIPTRSTAGFGKNMIPRSTRTDGWRR